MDGYFKPMKKAYVAVRNRIVSVPPAPTPPPPATPQVVPPTLTGDDILNGLHKPYTLDDLLTDTMPYEVDFNYPATKGGNSSGIYRCKLNDYSPSPTTSTSLYPPDHPDANFVAVKEMLLTSDKKRHQVRREITNLQRCNHPNILKLLLVYTVDDDNYREEIWMATAPWAPLTLKGFVDLVSQEGTSPQIPWYTQEALMPWPSVVEQLLDGVAYLHSLNIKHEDLKPDNILLQDMTPILPSMPPNQVKSMYLTSPRIRPIIADFGTSKLHVEGEKSKHSGTYQYMAPEQTVKQPRPTSLAADIYSLACCLSFIHVAVASPPWTRRLPGQHSMRTYSTHIAKGFSYVALSSLPWLRRLRKGNRIPRNVGPLNNVLDGVKLDFLCTVEGMLERCWEVDMERRPLVGDLIWEMEEWRVRTGEWEGLGGRLWTSGGQAQREFGGEKRWDGLEAFWRRERGRRFGG